MHADLRIVGRTPEEQAIRVGASVLLPLLFGPWVGIVCWFLGFRVPPAVLGGLSLVASAGGLVLPFASLRSAAAERRTAFSHALSSWCDVVVMTLASGRGVEQAMETASRAGAGLGLRRAAAGRSKAATSEASRRGWRSSVWAASSG